MKKRTDIAPKGYEVIIRKKEAGKKPSLLLYIGVSLFLLAVALVIGAAVNIILSGVSGGEGAVTNIIGMLEGIIGAIAAGMVLYQLKLAEKTEIHQNEISEASFLLQYNQLILQDPNMFEVERLLENQTYYADEPQEIITSENRQIFVNYLVYLESLAPLVLNGVFTIDHIDNLLAYRFFLATDNAEIQEKELLRFAEYYRGCFVLYKIWKTYRRERGLLCPVDDCVNKKAMKELDKWENFDKFSSMPACPEEKTNAAK